MFFSWGPGAPRQPIRPNFSSEVLGLAHYATQSARDAKSSTFSHFFPYKFPCNVPMLCS
ncbi:hypothetical protein MTR67_034942 [Solanum verrucosum]|uniref:Uncharacterized protein n=1 Tax=Solanum verrucosum TaxID=315347 RepID=A0AAF0U903_SOLVR|nr:hypothetical protein MTR67_034942 [Solanum verrucosum]